MSEKSANQLYKESGSSLTFKDWIEREKNKGVFIKNQLLEDVIDPNEKTDNLSSFKAKFESGIPKWVVISGIIVVVGAIAYNHYKK